MKRRVLLALVALAVALLGIALACGSNPITVATIVPADAAPIDCELSDAGDAASPCESGTFCSATAMSCNSHLGQCETIDVDGCATSGPECGCDGVTYFDQCLRQEAHVSRAGTAQCDGQMLKTPKPCDQCGSIKNASCAFVFPIPRTQLLFDAECHPLPDVGSCWSLPDTCADSGSQRVQSWCDPQCVDECSAIRDGGVYFPCSTPDASAAP